MQLAHLDGATLKLALRSGCHHLGNCREVVNALNVFPVPDGDTGTNMHLTLVASQREVEHAPDVSAAAVLSHAARGALMGARGNSGVILSQILRGFSQGVEGLDSLGACELARGWEKAVEVAYKSVSQPVEGTILTVARAIAEALHAVTPQERMLPEIFTVALRAGYDMLGRTPGMLPALARAGVVDAGGKGLLIWLEGFLAALQGKEVRESGTPLPASAPDRQPPALLWKEEEIIYQYCTEFLLKGGNLPPEEEFRERLSGLGDSLLVVGTAQALRVHIHTNNPGKVLDEAAALGSMHGIKIDNMRDQHRSMLSPEPPGAAGDLEGKPPGVLVVACGQGLAEAFRSLGADLVLQGGPTMNPSASELAAGAARVGIKEVILLPNNPNIIAAARQAEELADCQLAVVPTRNLAQGLAALLAYRREASLEENLSLMEQAASGVWYGEVTRAVRASRYGERQVREGEALGLLDGEITFCGPSLEEAVAALVQQLREKGVELVTLFYGEEITAGKAGELLEQLETAYPSLQFELRPGGQPLYPYILAAE